MCGRENPMESSRTDARGGSSLSLPSWFMPVLEANGVSWCLQPSRCQELREDLKKSLDPFELDLDIAEEVRLVPLEAASTHFLCWQPFAELLPTG